MSIPSTNFRDNHTNLKPFLAPEEIARKHEIKIQKQTKEIAQSALSQTSYSKELLNIRRQPPKRPAPIRPDKAQGKAKIPKPNKKPPPRPTQNSIMQEKNKKKVKFDESKHLVFHFDPDTEPQFKVKPQSWVNYVLSKRILRAISESHTPTPTASPLQKLPLVPPLSPTFIPRQEVTQIHQP